MHEHIVMDYTGMWDTLPKPRLRSRLNCSEGLRVYRRSTLRRVQSSHLKNSYSVGKKRHRTFSLSEASSWFAPRSFFVVCWWMNVFLRWNLLRSVTAPLDIHAKNWLHSEDIKTVQDTVPERHDGRRRRQKQGEWNVGMQ